ncbi:polyhydroxybutyrate depolymerase [Thalassococcus sp. S3]|nr:polyhydroxybutyrate depolymerase [Thalassococcus sp. S3]
MTGFLGLSIACLASGSVHAGCGPDPAPCPVTDGEYHIELPDAPGPHPVVMHLHGAGSNGANVMRNGDLVTSLTARGYAVIAPSARSRPGSRLRGVWNFYPGWEGRNDPRFLNTVIADAAPRFDLDPERVLLSGFSAGGFMVSYLACDTPQAFAAYAPVAGGFWRPHPQECSGPVKLFQTHGWRDMTVPLEGRPLGGGRFLQGDIFAGMEIWRIANDCPDMRPDAFAQTGIFMRRSWTDCDPQSALQFALFPGGHSVPDGWADMVLDWFEAEIAAD